jgi:hypothetical protein
MIEQVPQRHQPDVDTETHVVTLSICYSYHGELHEVFRGSEEECRDLAARITCCSNDRYAICSVAVTCELIKDWEASVGGMLQREMLREGSCDGQD